MITQFALEPALILLAFGTLAPGSTLVVECGTKSFPIEVTSTMACAQFDGVGLTSVQIKLAGVISSEITLLDALRGEQTVRLGALSLALT